MTVETAYQYLYGGALIVFLILIGAMVVRSIIGPRSTDRIMSVNMLGTMTISSIAILSFILKEEYLADVALIYAMISFVAVLMMASMFIPAKPKKPRLAQAGRREKEQRGRALRREHRPAQHAGRRSRMIEWIRFAIAAILMILALCSFIAAVTGAYRFGFVMNRMHAAGIGDTAGIFLVILSLAVALGPKMSTWKLLILVFFLWFTSPVSTHFLGQVEYYTNPVLRKHVKKAEIQEKGEADAAD